MRLPFEEKAARELEAAATFYEGERAGYGRLFLAGVGKKVARAAEFAKSGRRVSGTAEERDVRLFVLNRFSYTIVTALVTGHRVVVAVAHHHRRPDYWKNASASGGFVRTARRFVLAGQAAKVNSTEIAEVG